MTARRGKDAVKWLAEESGTGWYQLCLKGVRTALGVPVGAKSAMVAWSRAQVKHREGVPPVGVPVFWEGGQWGHVALSAGQGFVWSNDIIRKGQYDKVKISTITNSWGFKYLGWTEDLNGVTVYEPAPAKGAVKGPKSPVSAPRGRVEGEWLDGPLEDVPGAPSGVSRVMPVFDPTADCWEEYPGRDQFKIDQPSPYVAVLGAWLKALEFDKFHDGNGYQPGPTFTGFDRANCKAFQRAQGWTGLGADGYPGPVTWEQLRKKALWRLRDRSTV